VIFAAPDLLIFIVPIVDRSGDVIEEHLVSVRARCGTVTGLTRAPVDTAAIVAANACRDRARRVARLRRLLAQRASSIERALADHVTDHSRTGEAQPGLFDRRGLGARERDCAEIAEIRRRAAERLARYDDGGVAVGKPQLVFVFRPGR
jgi:hypothetical protein